MPVEPSDTCPNMAISLLKAQLMKHDIDCDNYYFSRDFENFIGGSIYAILSYFEPLTAEWFFSAELFAEEDFDPYPPISKPEIKRIYSYSEQQFVNQLYKKREKAADFIDHCISSANWDHYQLIGFTTTFSQTNASLLLAKKIKTHHPDVAIVFGGASCAGECGLELHKQFPFIDWVVRGEGDDVLPALAGSLISGQVVPDLAGLVYRNNGGESVETRIDNALVPDLSDLPPPNFDDYFSALDIDDLSVAVHLPVQFSRGCWWGQKKHCVFCGYNQCSIRYRTRPAEKILEELIWLSGKYNLKSFLPTDSILDHDLITSLFPKMIEQNLGMQLYLAVKTNLKKEQLHILEKAGVTDISPGIESLSTKLLEIMEKGCTLLQNVQMLKWCQEFNIKAHWNLLYGFPQEDPQEYADMVDLIPSILHLRPPHSFQSICLTRFSPLLNKTKEYGIKNVRPAEKYHHVFPFNDDVLSRLVDDFDFDYANGQEPHKYVSDLKEEVIYWRENYSPFGLVFIDLGKRLVIFDHRPSAIHHQYDLTEMERAAYLYCDLAHSLKAIQKEMALEGFIASEQKLEMILGLWVKNRIMLHDNDKFLSLAVSARRLVELVSEDVGIKQVIAEIISKFYDDGWRASFTDRLLTRK